MPLYIIHLCDSQLYLAVLRSRSLLYFRCLTHTISWYLVAVSFRDDDVNFLYLYVLCEIVAAILSQSSFCFEAWSLKKFAISTISFVLVVLLVLVVKCIEIWFGIIVVWTLSVECKKSPTLITKDFKKEYFVFESPSFFSLDTFVEIES